jgi:hypothetical protein
MAALQAQRIFCPYRPFAAQFGPEFMYWNHHRYRCLATPVHYRDL